MVSRAPAARSDRLEQKWLEAKMATDERYHEGGICSLIMYCIIFY